MSVTTLFFVEGLVIGASIAAGILIFMWAWDLRDLRKKREDELMTAYEDGYKDGGRLRFRERCAIERRCRELEDQITEIIDEEI